METKKKNLKKKPHYTPRVYCGEVYGFLLYCGQGVFGFKRGLFGNDGVITQYHGERLIAHINQKDAPNLTQMISGIPVPYKAPTQGELEDASSLDAISE
jgi:hypothetical protein